MIKNIKRSKSILVILECLGVIILSLLVCLLLYKNVSKVETFQGNIREASVPHDFHCYLDYVSDNGKDVSMQGWSYIEGESTEFFDCAIVLKQAGTDVYYRIPTALQKRNDVTEAYGSDTVNYDHSGFFARVQKSKIPSGNFEIYIEYGTYTVPILYNTNRTLVI